MNRINTYISYAEATKSYTAKRLGISNNPPIGIVKAMEVTAQKVFQPVREHFNTPISISSFYRSVELNKAIGGSATSQHCKGEAIDIDADIYGGVTNEEIFNYIKDNLEFDQLIAEGVEGGHVQWVHVSYTVKKKNRKQVLIMAREKGKTKYYTYSDGIYKKYIK